MHLRRALVVGVDGYPERTLHSCCNDASEMKSLLSRNHDGSPNWTVDIALGRDCSVPVVTRASLMQRLSALFACAANADLLFYFSGHAVRTPWGTELATQEGLETSRGVSFNDIVAMIDSCHAASVTVILDCCYSGDFGTLPRPDFIDPSQPDPAYLPGNVTILSSSQSEQASAEGSELSDFTDLITDGLRGIASDHLGAVTALGLYAHAAAALTRWEQQPQLKANCVNVPILRLAQPRVCHETLRALPTIFGRPISRIQLTPAHEGAGRPLSPGEGTPEQRLFDLLGELRDAGLVTNDAGRSHYWLAMHSGTVRLNKLGQHLWRVAETGAI